MRTSKAYLFRDLYSNGVSHHHSCLGESESQSSGKTYQWTKGESFTYALIGACWYWEVGGGQTRSLASYVIG